MPQRSVAYPAKWNASRGTDQVDVVILQKNKILARIAGGIARHFPIRVSEWIMTYALFGWGAVLWIEPETFSKNPSLSQMSLFASEHTWSMILFAAGYLRLAGLIVNGTFRDNFKYSPHFRGFASIVACFVWGQITLGILLSYYATGTGLTGLVIYSAAMMTDLWNLFRAWADVGAYDKANTLGQ
jgi:hypothetical protein